jgi:hypothetical protein
MELLLLPSNHFVQSRLNLSLEGVFDYRALLIRLIQIHKKIAEDRSKQKISISDFRWSGILVCVRVFERAVRSAELSAAALFLGFIGEYRYERDSVFFEGLHMKKWLAPNKPVLVLFAMSVGGIYIHKALLLLIAPMMNPDSDGYITFADYRPPGYPIFLYIHRLVFGGFNFLPHVQTGLFFVSVALLSLSVAHITRHISTAVVVFLLGACFAPGLDFINQSVWSDSLYASLLALGAASFIFSVSANRPTLFWLPSFFFALAATTKTIGYTLIIAFGLSIIALLYLHQQRTRTILLTVVPTLLVLGAACMVTYAQTGHFRIASYGGMSLLGKGLMVASPLPPERPMSVLNWVADETKPAQVAVRGTPSIPLKMLMVRQYYEYLRWNKIVAEFDDRWPAWTQSNSLYDRQKLAFELSREYIANNIEEYAKLVLFDYFSLWTMPRFLTTSEHSSLQLKWEQLGEVAFLTSFDSAASKSSDYRVVVPQPQSAIRVWLFRLVSGSFLLVSALVPIILLKRPHNVSPIALACFILMGLIVHLTYIATALVEAGLERYIFPTWPVIIAALALSPMLLKIPSHLTASIYQMEG